MVDVDMYAIGDFAGMFPLACEIKDPHCEGTPNGWGKSGTEPMTSLALDLLNIVSVNGYKVKQQVKDSLSVTNDREVRK